MILKLPQLLCQTIISNLRVFNGAHTTFNAAWGVWSILVLIQQLAPDCVDIPGFSVTTDTCMGKLDITLKIDTWYVRKTWL